MNTGDKNPAAISIAAAQFNRDIGVYNITNKKASDQLQKKFMHEGKHLKRSAANNEMYVSEKP